MENNIMVSISSIVYNQSEYIKDFLNGILSQKCNFRFELLIHDDASIDGTEEIIREYEAKYPEIIKPLYEKENQWRKGIKGSVTFNFPRARGKYIAICEGDDYWIDPLKLQKQVDFLENNPEYNMVVGRYKFLYQKTGKFKDNKELFKIDNNTLSLRDYIAFNFSHTSTFLFRNNVTFPNWLKDVYSGDQSIFITATGKGLIKYMNDFFSVYRVHSTGVSQSFNNKAKESRENIEKFLNYVDDYTKGEYSDLITFRKKLSDLYFHFEKSKSPIMRKLIMSIIYIYKYYGINFLAKKK